MFRAELKVETGLCLSELAPVWGLLCLRRRRFVRPLVSNVLEEG